MAGGSGDAVKDGAVADGRASRSARRTPSSRATNLTLLATLLLVFATGLGAVATGSARGRWVVVAHGIAAIVVILLIPWKTIVIRRGLRRRRTSRWASIALVGLVLATLVAGLVSVTGLVRSVGGFLVMWLHIAIALVLVPLLIWHLVTRPVRLIRPVRLRSIRPTDRSGIHGRAGLSRRTALRAGLLAGIAAFAYTAGEMVLRVSGAPGGRRRFTGSHEIGSADPAAMPVTSWLDDRVPAIDAGTWRLTVIDSAGRCDLALPDLAIGTVRVRATLDCTSGWYAEHDWSGVPVSALIRPDEQARSLYVHSVTGYWVRLPVEDLDSLVLATQVGGQTLSPGHGFPLRLVAPDRRGFWWVKWVDRIELDPTPAWWQPPLPVT